MEIQGLHSAVKASEQPLERLAASPSLTQDEKIGEVCRQFEAVLLRQILNETQKTVIHSSLSQQSTSSSIYQDMIANQLADNISRSGAFGLAHTLQQQLTHQLSPAASHENTAPSS